MADYEAALGLMIDAINANTGETIVEHSRRQSARPPPSPINPNKCTAPPAPPRLPADADEQQKYQWMAELGDKYMRHKKLKAEVTGGMAFH